MKFATDKEFEKVNMFGKGMPNEMFAKYFIGNSFLNLLVEPGKTPVFLANVTFEPACRNNWHIHHAKSGGGQMLICTAGEGWYQEEGKKAVSLSEGSFIYIPSGVKHWHGAKSDSWFSHLSLEIPGTKTNNEWLEPVSDEEFGKLPAAGKVNTKYTPAINTVYPTRRDFKKANMFGFGMYNFMFAKYFSGRSYLKMITAPGRAPLFLSNVTFEPGCRNNWHVHTASKGGGQLLICTAGQGWYQEEGKEAVSLKEGSIQFIPANVKHWHGAKADTWFSHIAIAIPGEDGSNDWKEEVSDAEYAALKG